jgi:hypothetical protein
MLDYIYMHVQQTREVRCRFDQESLAITLAKDNKIKKTKKFYRRVSIF